MKKYLGYLYTEDLERCCVLMYDDRRAIHERFAVVELQKEHPSGVYMKIGNVYFETEEQANDYRKQKGYVWKFAAKVTE